MRGRDEDTGQFLSPSRSQQRREALGVLELAEQLAAQSPAQLEKLPIPEALLPHIADTRRITAHIARKRQLAFLAKQMRREDEETLDAIRDALDAGSETSKRGVALMHKAEDWRTRLLDGGDAALAALLDEYPAADRQRLRQLVRNALDERARNKPPRAFREIYQLLRELFADASSAGTGDAQAAAPSDDDGLLD